MQWHMLAIPTRSRLRQETPKFEASKDCRVRLCYKQAKASILGFVGDGVLVNLTRAGVVWEDGASVEKNTLIRLTGRQIGGAFS